MGTSVTPPGTPAELRQRALALRKYATHLDGFLVCTLGPLAGDDTWIGPAPHECAADLRLIRGRFTSCATALRESARLLEVQAVAASAAAATMPAQDGPR